MSEVNFSKRDVTNRRELERIIERYNIEIDAEFFNSDQQLFKSFMSMHTRGFLAYKNNSDISRTLV